MKTCTQIIIVLFLLVIKPCFTSEIAYRHCPSCAILRATYLSNAATLFRLLSQKVNPNSRCEHFTKAIREMLAESESPWHMIGYEIDPEDTPLLIATKKGNLVTVKLLIQNGADIFVKDSMGRGILHATQDFTILIFLIRQIKQRFFTLAMAMHPRLGAESPAQHLTTFILQDLFAAIIDAQDIYGNTALHKTAEKGSLSSILLLLSANAGINVPNVHGFTPLHFAAYRSDSEAISIAKSLLDSGAQLEAETKDHKKAYYFADFNGDPEKSMLHFLRNYKH